MEPSDEAAGQNLASSTEENYFVTYTFTDRSHSSRVAQSIMKLCMEDELFADVTILVEGKEFQLHRLVLSAQSCFFRSMFTSNLKEGRNRVIELQDVSVSVFQLLVDYIYHGTVKLRLEELQETYEVADMYQLTALFEECSRFLVRTVQVKNCLQIMWLADQHSDVSLYTAAKNCAKTHLSQLCDTEEFLNLPLRLLTDIIADGVPCSQNPTVAIKNWIHFNKEERDGFSEMLLSSLKIEEEYDTEEMIEVEVATESAEWESIGVLQRLQERIDAENMANPYCFQDDPKWGPNEQQPMTPEDTEGRLGNNAWCQCTNCKEMPSIEESICCHEMSSITGFRRERTCVCLHPEFERLVLDRYMLVHYLRMNIDLSRKKRNENYDNRKYRWVAYKSFAAMIYAYFQNGDHVSVPSCVVNRIRDSYPDPKGSYTGFKWFAEYSTAKINNLFNNF
ncbi:kelch repeat and BTB domain-containing protein 4 isoform X3 [Hyla sarda]|uniref:kelch repeat and BTB domain-containing protein 4 isoform X3 n=1 Tax=Hyla sarda TaxID=327740 RepID=UPI0024C3C02A|nr:kelch repeat and BTB domain-containing protein 4 isoform X3 [Hyla sarda]